MMFSGKSKPNIVFFVGFRALLLILSVHSTGIRILCVLHTTKVIKDIVSIDRIVSDEVHCPCDVLHLCQYSRD